MSTTDPDDRNLSALLKAWQVTRPLPAGFQDAVWRRIGQAEQRSRRAQPFWRPLVIWLEGLAVQPARAASVVAVFLALGAGLGWMQAHQHASRVTDELSVRYVRSVDPYEAIR